MYQLVEQHYPAFRDLRAEAGRPLPDYVQVEFDAYLKCGRLEKGFLRVRCEHCHAEKLVAFSCKKRGFCPSCGARRMAETAALLADVVHTAGTMPTSWGDLHMTFLPAAWLRPLFAASACAVLVATTGCNPAAKEAAGATLESRLQRLEDAEAIRLLLDRYIELNESRDYAAYSQLFAKDGELVTRRGRTTGPQAIHEFLETNFGAQTRTANDPLQGSSHLLSNIKIEVDGDTATATSRWTLLTQGGERPLVGQAGRYEDRLVRESGVWKFQQRTIQREIPADQPVQ